MESLWSGQGRLREKWCCARGRLVDTGRDYKLIAGYATWNPVLPLSLSTPHHGHILITYTQINTTIQLISLDLRKNQPGDYQTHPLRTRSTNQGGRGCNKFVPVLRGTGTKIAPIGDVFDQSPGGISWIRGNLDDHVGDHVVLSPKEGVFVISLGIESSYPHPPQSLDNSKKQTS